MRRYEVVKKKTKFDDAMAEMEERICRQFCHHGRSQCGIVYCLSRNDCEKVAAELQARLAARLGRRTSVRYPNLPHHPPAHHRKPCLSASAVASVVMKNPGDMSYL